MKKRVGRRQFTFKRFSGMSLWGIEVKISLPFEQYLVGACLVPGTGIG